MRRASTPTHTFTFPEEIPIEGLDEIKVTYSQSGKTVLKKEKSDLTISLEDNSASYTLTQEEANKFAPGKALVQVRPKSSNGAVLASQMIWLTIKPVLDSEVM